MSKDLDVFESAAHLFFQSMKRPQTWYTIIERSGVELDRPAATILMLITAHEPAHYRLHELAECLHVEAPTVTRKVQQLERAGLIERQQTDQDKRAFELRVTDKGHDIAGKVHAAQRAFIQQILSDWTEEERSNFVTSFARFSREIEHQTKANITP